MKSSSADLVCPKALVSDRGTHFLNEVVESLTTHYKFLHRFSTPYYPQCNGQAESTNKVIVNCLKKLVAHHRRDWDVHLPAVLWAYRMAYKVVTGNTPFQLMYGVRRENSTRGGSPRAQNSSRLRDWFNCGRGLNG